MGKRISLLTLNALLLLAQSGTAAAQTAAEAEAEAEAEEASAAAPLAPAETQTGQTQALRTFATALVSGFVGLDFGGRQMHYQKRVTNVNLRPYDLPEALLFPVAPGFAASAEVFPFALTRWPVLPDIGLNGRLNYNFASSKVGDVKASTRWFAWEANLRGRFRFGKEHTAPLLGIELGLGRQAFLFEAPGGTADILPSVDYYYVRFGADGRIPVGNAAVLVGAAYRHLQSRRGPRGDTVPAAGRFGEHFPHADISGLDLRLGGALRLNEHFEARVLLNYTRYGSTLNAKATDTYVAESAFDQMLNLDLGVAAFF